MVLRADEKRLVAFRPMEMATVPFGRLLAALGDIPDTRWAQGKRHGLSHLLLFSVIAVLAGATSYQGIGSVSFRAK
jgi:hypothetical protein